MSKLVNYCISCMKLDLFKFFIIPHWGKFPCYSNTRDSKKTGIKDVLENNGVQNKTKYYTIYRWLLYKVKCNWKHQYLVLSLIKLSPSCCLFVHFDFPGCCWRRVNCDAQQHHVWSAQVGPPGNRARLWGIRPHLPDGGGRLCSAVRRRVAHEAQGRSAIVRPLSVSLATFPPSLTVSLNSILIPPFLFLLPVSVLWEINCKLRYYEPFKLFNVFPNMLLRLSS